MTKSSRDCPGTSVRLEDLHSGRITSTRWEPRAEYSWDAGMAVGAYLEGLRSGKLLAVHCQHCRRTVIPPRAFCERCFNPIHELVELPARGTVNTFSLCYVSWDLQPLEAPEIPAVIWLDGADQAGILHRLGEVAPEEVRIGLRVEAVWKPAHQREGAITDILHWRPFQEGP